MRNISVSLDEVRARQASMPPPTTRENLFNLIFAEKAIKDGWPLDLELSKVSMSIDPILGTRTFTWNEEA